MLFTVHHGIIINTKNFECVANIAMSFSFSNSVSYCPVIIKFYKLKTNNTRYLESDYDLGPMCVRHKSYTHWQLTKVKWNIHEWIYYRKTQIYL